MVTEYPPLLRSIKPSDRARALVRVPEVLSPNQIGPPKPPEEMVTFARGFRPGLRVVKLD